MTNTFYKAFFNILNTSMNDLQDICKAHFSQRSQQPVQDSSSSDQSDIKPIKTKQIKKKKKQIPGMPKPPPNAFVLYIQQAKVEIQKTQPGLSIAAVTSIAAKQWKEASQDQKAHFRNLQLAKQQIYYKKKKQFIHNYNLTHHDTLDEKVYLKHTHKTPNIQVPTKQKVIDLLDVESIEDQQVNQIDEQSL